jgi:hypothetical protein
MMEAHQGPEEKSELEVVVGRRLQGRRYRHRASDACHTYYSASDSGLSSQVRHPALRENPRRCRCHQQIVGHLDRDATDLESSPEEDPMGPKVT